MSESARREAGYLPRRIQQGQLLGMPNSRPMPAIGPGVHELRVVDETVTWRVIYRIGRNIDVLEVFAKKTPATPKEVIDRCRTRLQNLGK